MYSISSTGSVPVLWTRINHLTLAFVSDMLEPESLAICIYMKTLGGTSNVTFKLPDHTCQKPHLIYLNFI